MLRCGAAANDPRVADYPVGCSHRDLAYWVPEQSGRVRRARCVAPGIYVSWERPASHLGCDAPAGGLFLGLSIYICRGPPISTLWPAQSAYDLRTGRRVSPADLARSTAALTIAVSSSRDLSDLSCHLFSRAGSVPSLARRDPSPRWQWPFVLSFTAFAAYVFTRRGALAIPFTTAEDAVSPRGRRHCSRHYLHRHCGHARGPGSLLPSVIG